MQIAFDKFTAPQPSAIWSTQFFENLTFEASSTLRYLEILEQNSVQDWKFSPIEPNGAYHSSLSPNEPILHSKDLTEIMAKMFDAFCAGSRSVCLTAKNGANAIVHFAKVCSAIALAMIVF